MQRLLTVVAVNTRLILIHNMVNFLQNTHNRHVIAHTWGQDICEFQISSVFSSGTAVLYAIPDNKVHGANIGPIWDRQDPDGPHVGPMNFAIWDIKF